MSAILKIGAAEPVSPPPLTLYSYQAAKIDSGLRLLRQNKDILLEEPTGSGKTLQGVALLKLCLGNSLTHAIVIAPQRQIEKGFLGRNNSIIRWPSGSVRSKPIVVPDGFVRQARGGKRGAASEILAYLADSKPGHVLACTHAAINHLIRVRGEALPASLERCLLFVDEAHHVAADGLSTVTATWQTRGGRLVYATATPYRGDGREVLADGMVRLRRSMAEHMDEGFAPGRLANEIVPYGDSSDHVTAKQFRGEEIASDRDRQAQLVAAIVSKWEQDGRPKTIVRVPPLVGGSGPLVEALLRSFTRIGARVLNAVGIGTEQQDRFLDALEAERGRTFGGSQYDVLVGIQRVMEGTDWPVCSHVYCVGIPGSLQTVVQLVGRAMRKKQEGHPSRDVAKVAFFAPCAGGKALERLAIEHSRHALMTCVFLADHEVGEEWIVTCQVRKGLGLRLDDEAEAEIDDAIQIDPETYATIKAVMAVELDGRTEITPKDLIESASRLLPTVSLNDLASVAIRLLIGEKSSVGERAKASLQTKIEAKTRVNPKIREAMMEAFSEVLEEFRSDTLTNLGSLRALSSQVHAMTGSSAREFSKRLRDSLGVPLNERTIIEWVREWKERTGSFPTVESGEIPGTSENWWNINGLLSRGGRGLPAGGSLAKLIVRAFGARNISHLRPLSVNQIRLWIINWREQTGGYPSKNSGAIPSSNGETWGGLNLSLARGKRGLGTRVTLAGFIQQEFGVRGNSQNCPDLTFGQIRSWIAEWIDAHGGPPRKTSGAIPNTNGESWAALDAVMSQGRRGLSEKISLPSFIAREFGYKHIHRLPDIPVEVVRELVSAYLARTGGYPKQKSGPIRGVNETWLSLDAAMRRGRRGLSAYLSLADFMKKEFSVRNRATPLPDLEVSTIVNWIQDYREKHGGFPGRTSGPIPGANGETWSSVYTCGFKGMRGLAKGCTVAKIIRDHFS